jgi:hypothetical protein
MSEPLAERLSRFTPDAGQLDRDALLFAAGRASARPGRRWKVLAGALAASQVLTLVLLWPRAQLPGPDALPSPFAIAPPVAVQPPAPEDPNSVAANWRLRIEPNDLPPVVSDSFVPDDPPLRACSAPPGLLN